jgi:Bacterial protein of unknown function (DUF885)
MRIAPVVLPALALLAVAACLAPATGRGDGAPAAAPRLPALLTEFSADERGVERYWSLPSDARSTHEESVDAEWRGRLEALDFSALLRDEQVDWLLLDNHLRAAVPRRAAEAARRAEIAELVPFADEITRLEEDRWAEKPLDPQAAAASLDALGKQVKELRERVKKKEEPKDKDAADADKPDDAEKSDEDKPDADKPSDQPPLETTAVLARRAARAVDDLSRALGEWYRNQDAFRPDFAWWTSKPYETASQELGDYSKKLREDVAGLKGEDDDPLVGDPIGRQALLDELAAEMLDAMPETLIALGEAELAFCEGELKKAAAEMGLGEDWKAALAQVKELHVSPGEQDDLAAAQAQEMLAFLDEHQLVTVPPLCRDTFRFTMIDEGVQKTLPYAAYGGQEMLVAYPTRAMDHDAKLQSMRGNNEHFSRIVTPHELIPGHHLQGYMAERFATQRRFGSTPFLGEGWALYWELRLWELGWQRGPEDRLGMLFWRAHRAARIVVSLKFHLGEMQPPEMIDFLVEHVGHEKDGATSEVRRYIGGDYGPLYQCAYLCGGLQLLALHDDVVGGGKMTEREFHDAVLRQGAMPIALIRAALTDEPLSRDAPPRGTVRRPL